MTQLTRTALGFLCLAAIGYLFSHAANAGTALEGIAYALGMIAAVFGFGMLAWSLLRPTEEEARATSTQPRRRAKFLA